MALDPRPIAMLEHHQGPKYRWRDSVALELQVACPHHPPHLALASHHPPPFALDNHVALDAGLLQIYRLLPCPPEGTLDPQPKPALLDLPLVRLCWVERWVEKVESRCVLTHYLLGPLGASEPYYLCSSPLHQDSS